MDNTQIVETKSIPPGALMLFGFPDAGLVGVIAASHIIDEFQLAEMAYVDSDLLPPVIVLHDGLPHSSIRILGNGSLLLAISEVPISAETLIPIMDALIEWAKNKKVKLMISMGGIPVPERQDLKELMVFAAASNADLLKEIQGKGLEMLKEGFMVGAQAVILLRSAQQRLPAVALLSQCFLHYPDPEAAAEVLKGLNKISGVNVNVEKLLERGEEIRLKVRDMMKRTQEEMQRMKKGQELDLPVYVS